MCMHHRLSVLGCVLRWCLVGNHDIKLHIELVLYVRCLFCASVGDTLCQCSYFHSGSDSGFGIGSGLVLALQVETQLQRYPKNDIYDDEETFNIRTVTVKKYFVLFIFKILYH